MSLRQYNTELGTLIDKIVKVYIDKDKFFVGQLKGISEDSNLILINAKNEKNKAFPKLFIRNNFYNFVSLEEEPFPMQALADRIATIFTKGHVASIIVYPLLLASCKVFLAAPWARMRSVLLSPGVSASTFFIPAFSIC